MGGEGRRREEAGAKNSLEVERRVEERAEERREVVVVEKVGSMEEGGREVGVKASVSVEGSGEVCDMVVDGNC